MDAIADDIINAVRWIGKQGWWIDTCIFCPERKGVCILTALKFAKCQYVFPTIYTADMAFEMHKCMTNSHLEAAYDNKITVKQSLSLVSVLYSAPCRDPNNSEYKWGVTIARLIAKRGCMDEIQRYMKRF